MPELPPDYFNRPLSDVDPEIAELLGKELERQQRTLEMIASENFVPQAVLECQGSVLTNKYAEGYPGKRYYAGCEYVDQVEQLAIDRAKQLFGAEHANVQPHAGAQTNAAVYHALLDPGDRILGLALPHGGHLTHGMKLNLSGRLYDVVAYEVSPETHLIDMDEVERQAKETRPKLIIAGWSAYPRHLDFARFRQIADEVGAYLLVDMAHFAGLVAAGLHPSPVPHADVVTTTVHKTLGGARGGMILCREEYAKKINSAVFPGQQGGPLEHIIAGKAVSLGIAQTEVFRERQQRTLDGANAVVDALLECRPRGQRPDRRHGRAPRARRPSRLRDRRPAVGGSPARDRHHRQPQRRAVRPAPADGDQRTARGNQRARDARPSGRGLRRGRRHHGHGAHARSSSRGAASSPSGSARSPIATRCTSISPRLPRCEDFQARSRLIRRRRGFRGAARLLHGWTSASDPRLRDGVPARRVADAARGPLRRPRRRRRPSA